MMAIRTVIPAKVVPPGKVVDFIDGTLREYTPEEYVRQETLKQLVRELGYGPQTIVVEWSLKMGAKRHRADIAVFPDGLDPAERTQDRALILVECKKRGTSPQDKREGIEQLYSYIAACPGVELGMWTNGTDLAVVHVVRKPDGSR